MRTGERLGDLSGCSSPVTNWRDAGLVVVGLVMGVGHDQRRRKSH
jgi:hypothetical protein